MFFMIKLVNNIFSSKMFIRKIFTITFKQTHASQGLLYKHLCNSLIESSLKVPPCNFFSFLWNKSHVLKYFLRNKKNLISCCIFAQNFMSLPRKIMEQCRLCPTIMEQCRLCPAKSRRLCSLPRKIMEQRRLCSKKLWRHSFRGQQVS